MRCPDGRDPLRAAHVIEEHAAAAVDLAIDEAGREQPLDAPPGDIGRDLVVGNQRDNAAGLDDNADAFEKPGTIENPRAAQSLPHQRVSVT